MCPGSNNSREFVSQLPCVHRTATNHCRNVGPDLGGYMGTGWEIGAALSRDESGPDLTTTPMSYIINISRPPACGISRLYSIFVRNRYFSWPISSQAYTAAPINTIIATGKGGIVMQANHVGGAASARAVREEFAPTDFSVVVKRRGSPPKPWRWEIYCACKAVPIERSPVFFDSAAAATKEGKRALTHLLAGWRWRASPNAGESSPPASQKDRLVGGLSFALGKADPNRAASGRAVIHIICMHGLLGVLVIRAWAARR